MGHPEAELSAFDLHSTLRPEHAVTLNNNALLGTHCAPGPGLAQQG